ILARQIRKGARCIRRHPDLPRAFLKHSGLFLLNLMSLYYARLNRCIHGRDIFPAAERRPTGPALCCCPMNGSRSM
ncbi:MAG: hypothetical protein AB1792_04670, partial [Candidatus Zixiibacteriota bacterium]